MTQVVAFVAFGIGCLLAYKIGRKVEKNKKS